MPAFHAYLRFLATVAAVACAGCVVVNPSNVNVSGFNSGPSEGPPATPYASALQKVIHQQEAVARQVKKAKWSNAEEEIDDWVKYTRKLMGYAETSRDPARFRAYCNELLAAIDRLRLTVRHQEPRGSQEALHACDPILNKFSRDFPLTAPAGPAPAHASPPPPDRKPPARAP